MAGTAAILGVGAAGLNLAPGRLNRVLAPVRVAEADREPDLYWAGTDGWIHLPDSPAIPPFFPDNYATPPFNLYIFGFRNITGLDPMQISGQKMKAQHSAPLFWLDQYNGSNEFHMRLTNLGLQQRPDLTDSHTIHWHGFRNVIPFYDGEPTTSLSVPVNRNFTYVYRPHEPGTYMYHCHVEDVEHVHMGMTGPVFVRPALGPNFAYNDPSTAFDREFAMLLSEVWAEAHWADSHIQLPEWSDYHVDFALLNGRVYPDTLAPNSPVNAIVSPIHAIPVQRDSSGDLVVPPAPYEHLQYQPLSARITCNQGERVLLRFANLGFKEASMTLAGIKMRVVGRDATLMRSRDGTDISYETDTLSVGVGESFDVICTAPPHSGGPGPDKYVLYNRRYGLSDNLANTGGGFGGQRTEVHVYPSGTLGPQAYPNDWGGAA